MQYEMLVYFLFQNVLLGSVAYNGYPDAGSLNIETLRVLGVSDIITSVKVQNSTHVDWLQDSETNVSHCVTYICEQSMVFDRRALRLTGVFK